jgi:hypothetical protein
MNRSGRATLLSVVLLLLSQVGCAGREEKLAFKTVDASTLAPLSKVRVSCNCPSTSQLVESNGEGIVTFSVPASDQPISLEFEKKGYLQARAVVLRKVFNDTIQIGVQVSETEISWHSDSAKAPILVPLKKAVANSRELPS